MRPIVHRSAQARPLSSARAAGPEPARIALLPWMVAGVRTQFENLRRTPLPSDLTCQIYPIVPYHEGGRIERLPVLRSSHKGTLRSTADALPVLRDNSCAAIWTQALLPLVPLLLAGDSGVKRQPPIVYTIDTTPRLMDGFGTLYEGTGQSWPAKRALRDALYRYALRHCAAVTPWSQWAARSFMRDYGVPRSRVHVLPPGVDLKAWSLPSSRRHRRRSLFRLLFVGADFERKGGPLLCDVFRSALRETCELHLVTRAAVREEPGVYVYRGFGPNDRGLRDLYERSDALVLPTQADCFSLAAIEAMACGLPVISCPVGGIPEIVEHTVSGFLVPPGDGRLLLAAIRTLVDQTDRAQAMGYRGRRIVEERFDSARTSEALFALIRRVIAEQQS